ncbi:4Fe-4S dicluster domain-containing protein [Candidatus Bathyarchaeota archaeon A05DMB-2]|jgi:ferredoxin|nr:4Fe-4S dicluster domain-containing protein [Candidatus Bathyarchaeota archaeon A05DMB-2]
MVRILLRFSEDIVEQPITSQIILELKVPINIITAHVNSKGGEVLAEVPDESLDKVVKAFRKRGAKVSIPKLIEVDAEKCVSCGACVTLCPVEAITIDEDASVVFNKEKCIGSTCSACVDACPSRAIKSVKQNNSELVANNAH